MNADRKWQLVKIDGTIIQPKVAVNHIEKTIMNTIIITLKT